MKPLLAVLFAVPFAAATAQTPEVRRDGPHTAVLVRRGPLSEPLAGQLADAALAAAELAWTTLQKPLQLPANGPRVTVVLYAAEPEFRTAEKTGCTLPFTVEAFPSFADATAHVLLWPKLSVRALDRIGLPASTRDAVLHTAAMLHAQRATGTPPEARDRLEIAAAGALALAYNPKGQDGIDAAYDTNRWEFTAQGQKGKVPDLRAWLQDGSAVTNRRDHDTRLARWAVLAQAMEPQGNWLKKLLQKPKAGSSLLAPYEAVFGPEWSKTQARFAKSWAGVAPRWQLSQPVFERRGARWLMVGDEERQAAVYGATPPPAVPYAFRATIEREPLGSDELRLQLDWDGTSMLGVLLHGDAIHLCRWQPDTNWRDLQQQAVKLPTKQAFDFAVEVGPAELRVFVDGTRVATWPHDRRMQGQWSLACGDTLVWLSDPRVEPLAPAKK